MLADALAADVMKQARVETFERLADVPASDFETLVVAHPLRQSGLGGYSFDVPLLAGEHVTAEAGTGFVHTAPGHGREDFDLWMEHRRDLEGSGVDTRIPYTVDADGRFTADAPGFEGRQVITEKGEKGDANQAVIEALTQAGNAHCPRPPEAPIPAFVAVAEAGDLPQHAAMVHPHGPRHRGARRYASRPRAEGHRRYALRASRRAEPPCAA